MLGAQTQHTLLCCPEILNNSEVKWPSVLSYTAQPISIADANAAAKLPYPIPLKIVAVSVSHTGISIYMYVLLFS